MEPIRVAIIDEHGIVRRGLQDVFERNPLTFVVGEADEHRNSLALVASAQPDVVIVDPHIASPDGAPLLPALLRASPHSALLVFCDVAEPAEVEEAIAEGASGFLLKTARPEQLALAVQALASGHIYLQPEVTRAFIQRLTGRGDGGVILVTAREMEVLQLVANGMSTAEAAFALDRSQATVKTHIRSVFKKLGAKHRAHAVAQALRLKLIR
ncbi:MAG: response regulator transcription factor [Acidimicrobiia bacterium]|nr:response regulator transcription factor [Acidimicrobiia bacterium]